MNKKLKVPEKSKAKNRKFRALPVRVTALLLALVTLLSMFSFSAFAAEIKTDSVGLSPTFAYCTDSNGNYIKSLQATAWESVGEIALFIKYNGQRAYCIEPGVHLKASDVVTDNTNASDSAWKNLGKNFAETMAKQNAIKVALCLGLEGNASAVKFGSINEYEAYLATQLIIWEIVKGERNTVAPYNLNSGKNGFLSMYCNGGKNNNIKLSYNKILEQMANFQKIPTFTKMRAEVAPTVELYANHNLNNNTWTYSTAEKNDDNGVLSSNYTSLAGTYDLGNGTVKVTQSGNKITFSIASVNESGTGKTISLSTERKNVPKSSSGKLIAYGSSSVQDCVTGGEVDPPTGYINVKITITEKSISRDGRIQKSCWTPAEAEDFDTAEGEGKLSTSENLEGWYFYVTVPSAFKTSYGTDHVILGPTDLLGFTQTVGDYVKENIDSGVSSDIPIGDYYAYELGKLKSGSSGNSLSTDYYFPDGWEPNGSSYAEYINNPSASVPCATIRLGYEGNRIDEVGFASNIHPLPLQIAKSAQDGSSVEGYYFRLTAADGSTQVLGPTDSEGLIYSEDIEEGAYTVEELGLKQTNGTYKIPAWYDDPPAKEVEISADAFKNAQEAGFSAIRVDFLNTCSGYIEILKTDSETGAYVQGAVYGIYSDESCENLLEELTTNGIGRARSANKYPCGETFYVKEITAPPGYKTDKTVYEVVIAPVKGAVSSHTVAVKDTPILGLINLKKTSDDGIVTGVWFNIKSTAGYDENVEITLRSGTVTVNNLRVYDSNGNQIEYTVTELGFYDEDSDSFYLPENYCPQPPATVTLDLNPYVGVFTASVSFHNSIKLGNLLIEKTAEDNIIENVWFNVSCEDTGIDYGDFTTDSEGKILVEDLPVCDSSGNKYVYVITELGEKQADGTYKIPERYKEPQAIKTEVTYQEETTVSFKNALKTGSVTLNKQDENGDKLTGAQFRLYTSDGKIKNITKSVAGIYTATPGGEVNLVTDSNGRLYISGLAPGTYYFIEIKAPAGYMPYGKKIEFTVSADSTETLNVKATVKDNHSVLLSTGGTGTGAYYQTAFMFLVMALVSISVYFKKRRDSASNACR